MDGKNKLHLKEVKFLNHRGESLSLDCVHPDLNFLGFAQAAEVEIGSVCGGHGICGKDVIQIIDAAMKDQVTDPSEIEIHKLGSDKISAGYRLACQVFIKR